MKDYGINLVNLNQEYETKEKIYHRTCPICGKEFEASFHLVKYCSKECASTAKAEMRKQWRKDNPERFRDYRRKYYQKNKKLIIEKQKESRRQRRELQIQNKNKIEACKVEHNNCFDCPTKDGECLYE